MYLKESSISYGKVGMYLKEGSMREGKGWDVLEGKFNEKMERLGVL